MDVVFYLEIGGGGDVDRGTNSVPSFGEREHALSFATQIRSAGYRPRFVVGPLIANHIRAAGFEPEVFWSPDVGIEIVERIDPALVVACELFNVSSESAQGLIGLSAPLATMDGTSLALEINADPFGKPELSRPLVLPDRYASFRPAPVNDAGVDTDDVFYWSLFPDAARRKKDPALYAELGLDASRRTVMFAAAPWAQGAASILDFDDQAYYRTLLERLWGGLCASGQAVDFLSISMFPLPALPESQGGVRLHRSGLMAYEAYDHVLSSCDLIVSDNMIQTSVSKAVAMGTPHLIVQNTSGAGMPHPCNMFPLKLLFPADREYAQVVDVVELADADGIADAVCGLLERGHLDAEREQERRAFRERLGGLSRPGAIVERVIGPAQGAPS